MNTCVVALVLAVIVIVVVIAIMVAIMVSVVTPAAFFACLFQLAPAVLRLPAMLAVPGDCLAQVVFSFLDALLAIGTRLSGNRAAKHQKCRQEYCRDSSL